jgi:hypothetical protein
MNRPARKIAFVTPHGVRDFTNGAAGIALPGPQRPDRTVPRQDDLYGVRFSRRGGRFKRDAICPHPRPGLMNPQQAWQAGLIEMRAICRAFVRRVATQ